VDEMIVDGNAAAGDLQEVFAVEVTELTGVCAGCGAAGMLAEARVFERGPGLVLRCRDCDGVLARLARLPDRTLLELRGLLRLEIRAG
jgi:Family of unknown function (DUF6510)